MTQSRRILLLALAICTITAVSSARAERFWVELPRAGAQSTEIADLPYPPAPTPRAQMRRSLRGRADRIVALDRGPDPSALDALRSTGVRIRSISRWLSAASVEASREQVARLRATFGRERVRPVRTLRGRRPDEPTPIDPRPRLRRAASGLDYGPSENQVVQVQIDQLHAEGFTGRGIRVLVLDTGFRLEHQAFAAMNVVDEWDFVHDDPETGNEALDPAAQDRHGTGVLATLGAYAPGDLIGGAFGAEFLVAKTEWVATETRVEEDDFVAALEWGEALGADLMSASLGYRMFYDEPDSFAYAPSDLDGDTAVTTRALDDLVALGVVALTAVGNDGPDPATLITPSDGDSVLAIGAVDTLGAVTPFSSRGPTFDGRIKPDLCAQGKKTIWAEADGTYAAVSGTSLATPVAAGAVALVLEAHPEWGPGDVMQAVRSTATEAASPDNVHGYGILKAHDAAWTLAPPVFPLPFELLAPADSAFVASAPVQFRWHRAVDVQTPDALVYRIQLSNFADFADTVGVYDAGFDSTRSVGFLPDGDFFWRVVATDPQGHERVSRARAVSLATATAGPAATRASWAQWTGPSPNPSADAVTTMLSLRRPAHVEVSVYDVAGRRVRRLLSSGSLPMGDRLLRWDGRDGQGNRVSSGVYLLRAVAQDGAGGRQILTARLTLLR